MDVLLIVTAAAAGMSVFYVMLGLQNSILGQRSAIRARTLDDSRPDDAVLPLQTRRLNARLLFSGEGTELKLIRAGWNVTVVEYRFFRLVSAVLVALVMVVVTGLLEVESGVIRFLLVLVVALAGSFLPVLYLGMRRGSRLRQIEDQLPIALTSMSKALGAGTGLLQAMDYAAEQTPKPLGPELARAISDLRMGGDAEIVFEELNRRIGSPDLAIVTTAIVIQRRVGGNLSEILTGAANTIRERHEIHREVRILTARQRVMGNIVALIPVAVAILFYLINPDIGKLLFTETTGQIALAFAIVMELIGIWAIGRLSVIEV
ncbi:MAG TPA: type II secretion system F family protein [Dehalococcoidia bacterium]|nr:type II secretion system F family protein [Dehalococcoidia bacterium]